MAGLAAEPPSASADARSYSFAGCKTCKQRRVKCDEKRPTCGPCERSSRACGQDDRVLFVSENAFAAGHKRRARGGPRACGRGEEADEDEKHQQQGASDALVQRCQAWHLHATRLAPSLQHQAANYYLNCHLDTTSHPPVIAKDHSSRIAFYWRITKPGSALNLTLSAIFQAAFAKARGSSDALLASRKFYVEALMGIRKALQGSSDFDYDQTLLAIILMCRYENFAYNAGRTRAELLPAFPAVSDAAIDTARHVTPASFWHHEGAIALLQRRQHYRSLDPRLHAGIRRQIVRSYLLSAIPLSPSLQDGSLYGETDDALDLDRCLVSLVDLAVKSNKYLDRDASPAVADLSHLLARCHSVDDRLAAFAETHTSEWPHRSYTSSPATHALSYGQPLHVYDSVAHAATWNQVRAARMLANDIIGRALHALSPIGGIDIESKKQFARLKIHKLADSFCSSLPFILGQVKEVRSGAQRLEIQLDSEKIKDEMQITPHRASMIAWPLSAILRGESIPHDQRIWLKDRLLLTARVLGDGVLEELARNSLST